MNEVDSADKEHLEPVRDNAFFVANPDQLTVEFIGTAVHFLNNFCSYFPAPAGLPKGFTRGLIEAGEARDMIMQDWLTKNGFNAGGKSERRLGETSRSFFDTLDEVVHQVCLDYDQRYREAGKQLNNDPQKIIGGPLLDVYVKTYKKMRALGYSHRDLVS